MIGYTKIFQSIVTSTIWQEDAYTKVVWITMLVLQDREHVVAASLPGLAKIAGVTLEQCEVALKKFLSPDKYSSSQEFEGRRIEVVPGGWRILNGEKYRQRMNLDERREYLRVKQAEYRARERKLKRLDKEAAARERQHLEEQAVGKPWNPETGL